MKQFMRAALLALLMLLLERDSPPPGDMWARLEAIVRAYRYDFVSWELKSIAYKVRYAIASPHRRWSIDQRKDFVLNYFHLMKYSPHSHEIYRSRPIVENILQEQLAAVIVDKGLSYNGWVFPPVSIRLTKMPLQLAISPRDKIMLIANISLTPDLSVEERARLEEEIERKLNVSALITSIGGMSTYPAMIPEDSNLEWTIKEMAHEWVHHYLLFRPLGQRYKDSDEMRTVNETVANIVSNELGGAMLARFYPEYIPNYEVSAQPAIDYYTEMAVTRIVVDKLLAAGKVALAEEFMETRRKMFADNGYNIRRINQAYFAYHSAYADHPGERGDSPIGPEIVKMAQDMPMRQWLDMVSRGTSYGR